MTRARVLVVEDDVHQREALVGFLGDSGYEVAAASDVDAAKHELRASSFDAVVTDFNLPGGTGLHVIQAAQELAHAPATLLVTAYGTIPLAVDAMRAGAVDVQVKPVDPQALLATLERALHTRALENENIDLRDRLNERFDFPEFVAESEAMRPVLRAIRQVAATRASVLITGESGTGKEMVAKLLHTQGKQPEAPFVAVHCAALPESLLESELFGHARGAFTGASADRTGRFEQAHGGTLFLDEVGEFPASVQVKLLRALQEREIVRVGENEPRSVSFRLIAATNVDLEREVAEGRFREDLYYRLNVVRIALPPLRERPEDIRPFVTRFIHECAASNDVPPKPMSEEALKALIACEFPGNVRQLRNVVEGALLVASGPEIQPHDLSLRTPTSLPSDVNLDGQTLREALERVERRLIRRALAAAEGVTARTADVLGIPDRTLRYKIRKLGIREEGNDSP